MTCTQQLKTGALHQDSKYSLESLLKAPAIKSKTNNYTHTHQHTTHQPAVGENERGTAAASMLPVASVSVS